MIIIDRIEHSGRTLTHMEYVGVGRRYDGFTTLQVLKLGTKRKVHIEVGQVRRIEIGSRVLMPSSPAYWEPRAAEIRAFFEEISPGPSSPPPGRG